MRVPAKGGKRRAPWMSELGQKRTSALFDVKERIGFNSMRNTSIASSLLSAWKLEVWRFRLLHIAQHLYDIAVIIAGRRYLRR